MEGQLKKLVSEILNIEEDDITDETGPVSIDAWDSLNHLKLITLVEEEFNIKLSMGEISEIDNFRKLKAAVRKNT